MGRIIIIETIVIRIDSCSKIHGLWNISRTTKARTLCDISNERAGFSAYVLVSGNWMEF